MPAEPRAAGEVLSWDSQFFGFPIGRWKAAKLSDESARRALAWSKETGLRCLYFLAPADDLETAHCAERHGFAAVDLRMTLQCDRMTPAETDADPATPLIRAWREDDLPALRSLASASHMDSRFFFDHRFCPRKSRELFAEWIEASCRGRSDHVLVAHARGQVAGYLAGSTGADGIGSLDLIAVAETARGQGLGKRLTRHWLGWLARRQQAGCRVVTQGRNLAALRLYQRHGFLPSKLETWYHRWFTAEESPREPV